MDQLSNNTQILLLRIEKQEHRIDVLESILMNGKSVLTLEEAATFMGISKSSLYKLTHNHEIPFYRPNGKLIYFEKEEILKWMRKNRSMSMAEIGSVATQHMDRLCL